jgi:hypothetical protein
MKDSKHGVPAIDLAPRLNRPLSLWNPLDYLRLLYWVFYFPQAIRWYVNVISQDEEHFYDVTGWQKKWRWLLESSVKRDFFLQGLILQILVPFGVSYFCQQIGCKFDSNNLRSGILLGIVINILFGISSDVGEALLIGVTTSTSAIIVTFFTWGISYGITLSIFFGVLFGASIGFSGIADAGIPNNIIYNFASLSGLLLPAVSILVLTLLSSSKSLSNPSEIVMGGILFVISWGISFAWAFLRPDLWIWGFRPGVQKFNRQRWSLPRATPLPQYGLVTVLNQLLQEDWEEGLKVVYQLQRYTFQFASVIQSINFVLNRTSYDTLLLKVSQLSDSLYDLQLIKYVSASISYQLRQQMIQGFSFFLDPFNIKGVRKEFSLPRIDTPVRAAAAGFWYLHAQLPQEAEKAFIVVEKLKYGNEMLLLSQALSQCVDCSSLEDITLISFPHIPLEPHLRPDTWNVIEQLRNASEDIQVVEKASSNAARAYASNRALGSLTKILDNFQSLPDTERYIITIIAMEWRLLLLQVTGEIGDLTITQPVVNPYIIGDPVMGDRFIGRDDIMRQLEELWVMNTIPQSIVLYGHRRMGKTSILRNIATRLGSDTRIAYINLNLCEVCNSIGEVLLTLTDELAKVTPVPKPSDTDLLTLPEISFRRYMSAIAQTNQKLIIVLDEFETLETLISTGKISPDFLSYLRGLIQLSPNLAFAFAGLHTLEEMTADYFAPFFASILPVRVGFLDRPTTRQLLANPDLDYPLDFTEDLLDEAYNLTNGQPYLIQLIGFHLTRHYNTQVFEQGRPRNAQFSLEDLTTILNSPDFYSSGRYYFTGVWNQAAEQIPQQQPILVHLAHNSAQTCPEIASAIGLPVEITQQSLDILKRHDVADTLPNDPDRWHISIELFRLWLIRQDMGN